MVPKGIEESPRASTAPMILLITEICIGLEWNELAMARELLRHIFRKPVTVKYPFEKAKPTEGMRGRPVWDMDRCVGCELCFKDCPSEAIEMIGKRSEAEFKHHLDRCVFCGQCEDVCPTNAITMTEDYELASYDRAGMIIEFKRT